VLFRYHHTTTLLGANASSNVQAETGTACVVLYDRRD